jgi:hypothetical protein
MKPLWILIAVLSAGAVASGRMPPTPPQAPCKLPALAPSAQPNIFTEAQENDLGIRRIPC